MATQQNPPSLGFRQSSFTAHLDPSDGSQALDYLYYDIKEISEERITSPIVVIGKNGSGKSVFAKCVAGMMVEKDELTPLSSMGAGSGRIVLQDCLSHYFRGKILEHPSRVFDFDSDAMKRTINLLRDLCGKSRKILCNGSKDDAYLVGSDLNPSTLLQAKIMLVAERLAYYPTVLVLDEPAWGLSLTQAHAFLTVTIRHCHENGVPVLIVSHDSRCIPFFPGGIILLSRDKFNVTAKLVKQGERYGKK
jgi:energy-coupling factor transporter ATP-binding protein EcfA2